ncbi:MAG: hypothetical protein R2750_14620 [Bacteroidales bacterium]
MLIPGNTVAMKMSGAMPNVNVVDWILVELVKATNGPENNSFEIISRKVGFLMKDGYIRDINGIGYIEMPVNNATEFHIQILIIEIIYM